ncbi:hypothetical protein JCM8547_006616 [Rhodosporidiobolus lusitaniae]
MSSSSFSSTAFERLAQDDAWEHSNPLFGTGDDQDEQEHLGEADRDKLYAVLNLERTASQEDIQRAYRRLPSAFGCFLLSHKRRERQSGVSRALRHKHL